ncbi:MAG: hypothetical protein WCO77_08915 [bacterium]
MSTLQPLGSTPEGGYVAPAVTEEPLNSGGNYVSPASAGGTNALIKKPGTLGNSIIE